MDNTVKFTFSQIKYIISMYRLSEGVHGVKNVELAGVLGFSKPSVHNMLKSLIELGVVRQQIFGLAFFTDEGRAIAEKYTVCYRLLEKKISLICGTGAASENAICGLLADMPGDRIDNLYKTRTV